MAVGGDGLGGDGKPLHPIRQHYGQRIVLRPAVAAMAAPRMFPVDRRLQTQMQGKVVHRSPHLGIGHRPLPAKGGVAGTEGPQTAEIDLDLDGTPAWTTQRGNGPVDAIFNAISTLVQHTAVLDLYQVHAVTEGTDAQAEVSVRLTENGRTVAGRAADADTLVASAKAYVAALNRLRAKRQRGADAQAG